MKSHKSIRNMIIFAMLGALMFASKIAFEFLPNIHPITLLVMIYTVAYRTKALIPIYIFVVLFGAYYGFSIWWIPYLYIWTFQWAITMLIPQNIPKKHAMIVYPLICGLLGLSYGTVYAPAQALLFGYDFDTMLKWIATGLPWDVLHAIGNLGMGLLVLPLSDLLKKLDRKTA